MGTSNLKVPTQSLPLAGDRFPTRACCVVVEYLPGGTLKQYLIRNRRKKLAFKIVIQLALDLSRGWVSIFCYFFYWKDCEYFFIFFFWRFTLFVSILQFELPAFQEDCASWCQKWKYVTRCTKNVKNCWFWCCSCWSSKSKGNDRWNWYSWVHGPRGTHSFLSL